MSTNPPSRIKPYLTYSSWASGVFRSFYVLFYNILHGTYALVSITSSTYLHPSPLPSETAKEKDEDT